MGFNAGKLYIVLVAAILIGATALRFADPFFVQALRLIAFDSYQRIEPVTYDPEMPVRVVDVDEESLARIGQWPWPRTTMADLTNRLTEQGAGAVAFDVMFAEPDQTSPEQAVKRLAPEEARIITEAIAGKPGHDALFAEAVAATPTVLATALSNRLSDPPPVKAGFAIAGDDPAPFIAAYSGATRNLPFLDEAAKGVGSINWLPDRDQVIRRIPLIYRIGTTFIPTLVTESLRVAQGAGTYVLKASNASGETAFGEETGLNHIRVGDVEIPTDSDGGIWLKFRPSNPGAYIPAWKVLAGENDPSEVAGRIMLIGTSAPGLIDLRATPLDSTIAGVEVHAQAIEHILSGRSLTRPDYAQVLEIAIMLAVGVILGFIMPRLSASVSAVIGVLVVVLLLAGGWFAYRDLGLLLDPTYPAVALLTLVIAATLYVYRRVEQQRAEVRSAFGHYVSPQVVEQIIANPDKLELGGEVRELTLLFCDVRNFTSISERLTAHELTHFINTLLTPLSEIILDQRGTIDKYMGDAIMAFWNAPLDDPNHAENACRSALKMIARMEDLNRDWRKEAEAAGRPFSRVGIGIGLNSGLCCVGNLGSRQRFDYSAIGDDVNLASRIEGLSKMYGVPAVVSESTLKKANGLATLELDLMRVKGRTQATRVYTFLDALGADEAAQTKLLPSHTGMLEAYRNRRWQDAEDAVAAAREVGIAGLEAFYKLYLSRITIWRENPPPDDWDGSFAATSK
jgi:adenylate cyclase